MWNQQDYSSSYGLNKPGSFGGSSRGGSGGRFVPRGGRGRFSNRYDPNRHSQPSDGGAASDPPAYDLCRFYAKSGNCKNGDSCRFSHNIAVAFTITAHNVPIRSIGVINMPDSAPKILTGASDSSVKVWNLATETPTQDGNIQTAGKVEHLEVSGNTILWSVEEMQNDVSVGVVYLFDPNGGNTIAIKRSEEMPYTHPFGPIRSFTVATLDGVTYVVTAGGEGVIRTWRFDTTARQFVHLSAFEGHCRAVSSLLLQDSHLWSGSLDKTIKVWEVGTGKLLGTLNASVGGHTDAVSALEYVPAVQQTNEAYIASGGADGELKLWKLNGEYVHGVNHGQCITTIKTFQDTLGGIQALLVGLANGAIVIRSCSTMGILYSLDLFCNQPKPAVWSICALGQSCFACAGEDGNLVVWRVQKALNDKS